MSAYEEVLEQRIEDAYQAFLTAQTPEGRQAHYRQMSKLQSELTVERFLQREGQTA